MVQEVHADALKRREEELAAREMHLLGREINIIIQVIMIDTHTDSKQGRHCGPPRLRRRKRS